MPYYSMFLSLSLAMVRPYIYKSRPREEYSASSSICSKLLEAARRCDVVGLEELALTVEPYFVLMWQNSLLLSMTSHQISSSKKFGSSEDR